MIRTIAKKEFRSLFAAPSTWWMLALMQFLFAWFYFGRMDDYLQVQAQLAQLDNAPGATISVAAPLCSVLALMLMLMIPLFTMRLVAEERRNQTWVLLLTAPVSVTDIVLGKFLGLNLRNIPLELRNQFKAACAAKGRTMTEAVIEFMKKEVAKGKPRK